MRGSKRGPLDRFLTQKQRKMKEKLPFTYSLPEGWKWTRVKELSRKPQYGYTAPAEKEPVGPKMLRITDIQNGEVDWEKVPYCKINEKEFGKYKLEKDDILFARTGATTGKTFLVKKCPKAVFASYLIRLKVFKEKVIPEYVYVFFQSPQYWKQVNPRGGAQPNMNARILANLQIPLPPLEEQKRIVARIEEILSKVEEAKKLKAEARKDAEAIMQAALHEVFSKAEEKGWKWKKLREVTLINREIRNPSVTTPNMEFIYIDISSIEEGTGKIKEVKKILGKNAPSRARRVIHTNDVIMSTVRPYLKAFAIIPKEFDNQICSTGFAVLTCKEEILPLFLLYALFSDETIRQCNKMMVGAHYPALRIDQVARIKMPLPSLEEQKQIASYLNSIQEKILTLRKMQEQTEKILENITPVVLDRAFRGEL